VRKNWVVYAKRPFGGPQQVLKYLARYTHRVAISNHRLVGLRDGRVSFRYKDYAAGRESKVMTLASTEFIRRFLMHTLPSGFVRIRYYGFLANRYRKQRLAHCRSLLGLAASSTAPREESTIPTEETDLLLSPKTCPACGRRSLVTIGTVSAVGSHLLRRPHFLNIHATAPVCFDTS
jgi:hypothetical protein